MWRNLPLFIRQKTLPCLSWWALRWAGEVSEAFHTDGGKAIKRLPVSRRLLRAESECNASDLRWLTDQLFLCGLHQSGQKSRQVPPDAWKRMKKEQMVYLEDW